MEAEAAAAAAAAAATETAASCIDHSAIKLEGDACAFWKLVLPAT